VPRHPQVVHQTCPDLGAELITPASLLLSAPPLAATPIPPDAFVAPGIEEFFYAPILFDGSIFAINRLALMMLGVSGLLCLGFGMGARRFAVVPRGWGHVVEVGLEFVRLQIAQDVLGDKGKRYVPYLTAIFFFILAANLTGVIPTISLPTTSVIAMPLILALCTWVVFNAEGIRAHGFGG